jgi:hypothetical protein
MDDCSEIEVGVGVGAAAATSSGYNPAQTESPSPFAQTQTFERDGEGNREQFPTKLYGMLENQLVEINNSAAILRDSLAQDSTSSPSKSKNAGDDQIQNDGQEGSNPILVAQVVMLENANKVLESSIDSLRSDQQEKLAPLLERIALLEEEKRIMEEEMLTKIHCREQTISNLEDSLRKATQARLTKKKKNSALKTSQQLLARATKATSDSAE